MGIGARLGEHCHDFSDACTSWLVDDVRCGLPMSASGETIRIFLVEDDAAMRVEFERMVLAEPELMLAGSAWNLAEARELLRAREVDIVIVDLGLPDGDGAELIRELRETAPATAALVTTVFGDEAHVIRAVEAGARGYLLKDTTPEEFVRAVRMVHEGGAPLSPQIARHLLTRFAPISSPHKSRSEEERLTPREIDILTRISQGFSVAEAAQASGISHHTVTAHIKNIYSKLSVRNRVEAVNRARQKGWIR
jgi:DNA-binding NarL/FixJ family response regulator